jgi:1,6-anhydro-N-acetylmuramate kinase
MSGTSLDGVDLAHVQFHKTAINGPLKFRKRNRSL